MESAGQHRGAEVLSCTEAIISVFRCLSVSLCCANNGKRWSTQRYWGTELHRGHYFCVPLSLCISVLWKQWKALFNTEALRYWVAQSQLILCSAVSLYLCVVQTMESAGQHRGAESLSCTEAIISVFLCLSVSLCCKCKVPHFVRNDKHRWGERGKTARSLAMLEIQIREHQTPFSNFSEATFLPPPTLSFRTKWGNLCLNGTRIIFERQFC